MDDLSQRLGNADPARVMSDDHLRPRVSSAWNRAQVPPKRSSNRWRFLIPVAVVGLATTGAAVVAPVLLGIGNQGVQVQPDAQIPIEYVTKAGTHVACSYSVYLGGDSRSAAEESVAAQLSQVNWDGVGQKIYDHAVANPRTPQPDEVWTNDTPQTRDAISFKLSVVPMLEQRLPADLQGSVSEWRTTDTCEGPFR